MNFNGAQIERGVDQLKEWATGFNGTDFLHENPTTVLVTVGCLTLGSIIGYALTQPGKPAQKKKRVKPVKKIILTPQQTIDAVLSEFETTFLPLIGKLKTTVVERITEVQGEGTIEQDPRSYKEALEYQAKYLEESLLKLIMRLDGVETSEDAELKSRRKAAVKTLQVGHREVDNLNTKITSLKQRGVIY